jgi:hypothetical protein
VKAFLSPALSVVPSVLMITQGVDAGVTVTPSPTPVITRHRPQPAASASRRPSCLDMMAQLSRRTSAFDNESINSSTVPSTVTSSTSRRSSMFGDADDARRGSMWQPPASMGDNRDELRRSSLPDGGIACTYAQQQQQQQQQPQQAPPCRSLALWRMPPSEAALAGKRTNCDTGANTSIDMLHAAKRREPSAAVYSGFNGAIMHARVSFTLCIP